MALFGGGRAAEAKQPLPPNTGMLLVADVAGTIKADDAFWAERCNTIPSTALFVVVEMGAVRDHFRPVAGATFCEMLQSNDRHQWSYNGVDWATPDYHDNANIHGGSQIDWPKDYGRAEDKRRYLSFWGIGQGAYTGGCGSTSTALYTSWTVQSGWGQSCT